MRDVLVQMFEREQRREKFLESKHKEIKLRKAAAAAVLLANIVIIIIIIHLPKV